MRVAFPGRCTSLEQLLAGLRCSSLTFFKRSQRAIALMSVGPASDPDALLGAPLLATE